MEKQFFATNALIFITSTINTETLADPTPEFHRNSFLTKAHVGVNEQDILDEVQEIEDRIERKELQLDFLGPILTTTLTEYPDFVLALTYEGFIDIAEGLKSIPGNPLLRRDRYRVVARDLINSREGTMC